MVQILLRFANVKSVGRAADSCHPLIEQFTAGRGDRDPKQKNLGLYTQGHVGKNRCPNGSFAIIKSQCDVGVKRMTVVKDSIFYTFCPVVCSSHIALEKGFITGEFTRTGMNISHISELSPEHWQSHFTHRHPALFRDGGNIPPIWARSEGANTKVIGMVWTEPGGSLLVKENSPIGSVGDLKGKRIGLLRKLPTLIDFGRATEKKGIVSILEAHGLQKDDIRFVDIPVDIPEIGIELRSHMTGWWKISPKKGWKAADSPLVKALKNGEVDAIFATYGIDKALEELGIARVVYTLEGQEDWRRLVNIGFPYIITVSKQLASDHPDIVAMWMRATINAGNWASQNKDEMFAIFSKVTRLPEQALRKHYPSDLHKRLIPQITEIGIQALEIEKDFLKEHGFINNDFNVRAWVDDTFLRTALNMPLKHRVSAMPQQ